MIIPAAMNYYSAAEMLTKPDNNLTVIIASQMKELCSAAGSLEQDYKLPAQDHSFLLRGNVRNSNCSRASQTRCSANENRN
jgi:hypothetical protein